MKLFIAVTDDVVLYAVSYLCNIGKEEKSKR
jgi:hypothetical protein